MNIQTCVVQTILICLDICLETIDVQTFAIETIDAQTFAIETIAFNKGCAKDTHTDVSNGLAIRVVEL